MNNWISVKDRLPKTDNDVIICCVDGSGDQMVTWDTYYPKRHTWGGEDAYTVTHWMPLPDPPKQQNPATL